MKTDLRLVGIVVNLVKNGNADEKIPIIKCKSMISSKIVNKTLCFKPSDVGIVLRHTS